MTTRDRLLKEIESFLRQTGYSATRFGKEACNDGTIVLRLRNGAGCTVRRMDQLYAFMDANRPRRVKHKKGRRGHASARI